MGQQNQRFIRRYLQQHVQQQQQQHSSQHHNHQHQHHQSNPLPPYSQRQQASSQDRSRHQAESDMNRHINTSNPTTTNNTSTATEKLDISDVRDPSDINQLSAKQLKIILTRNCVDFKGVFEKEVLREKVLQLWIDCNEKKTNQNSLYGNDGSQDNDVDEKAACKICMEREINCVLLECGHMLTCIPCGRKLSECPICRQNITRCVRTFKG